MDASCQCGHIKFKTPDPTPLDVYVCHCLACRKQSSSAFGVSAIFPRFELPVAEPPLGCYRRPTDSGNLMSCYFCPLCGSRLIHVSDGGKQNTVSVKGGCLDGLDWTSLKKHIWCRRAVVPIPEGVQRWDGEPTKE
ncbi:MAG: hypothetical protein M1837_000228 [Sclerophora amabilis]|nr:MAG: hypothetical protein M1837_000228 [Sclerophora amabilis]